MTVHKPSMKSGHASLEAHPTKTHKISLRSKQEKTFMNTELIKAESVALTLQCLRDLSTSLCNRTQHGFLISETAYMT